MRIRVLPCSAGEHAGPVGSFTTIHFDDDLDIVYTEDLVSGRMTANPGTVGEAARRYAHLQAAAPSVEGSTPLIARVMEERHGNRPEQGAVA
jgi:hypothetical protein